MLSNADLKIYGENRQHSKDNQRHFQIVYSGIIIELNYFSSLLIFFLYVNLFYQDKICRAINHSERSYQRYTCVGMK